MNNHEGELFRQTALLGKTSNKDRVEDALTILSDHFSTNTNGRHKKRLIQNLSDTYYGGDRFQQTQAEEHIVFLAKSMKVGNQISCSDKKSNR